jgi:hypothetical protein
MKPSLLALSLLLALSSYAQKMKSGVAPFNHKDLNMISITFKGDIAPFLQSLKADLGKGQDYSDSGDGYPGLRWFGVQKQEWNNKRILIQLYWVAMADKQIVLISCVDDSGDDLLLPDTEMVISIKKYFKKRLN